MTTDKTPEVSSPSPSSSTELPDQHPLGSPDSVTLRDLYTMAQGNRDAVAAAARDLQFAMENVREGFNLKFEAMTTRMDALVDTTNHRLDSFEGQMEARRLEVLQAIGRISAGSIGAITKQDVPNALFGQLAKSRLFWAWMVATAWLTMPIVIYHWSVIVQQFHALPIKF